jgi:hypothetical protein
MAGAGSHRTPHRPFARISLARIFVHVSSNPLPGVSLFTGNMKASMQASTRASNTYGTQTIPGSGCCDRASGVELMNDPQEPLTVVR